MDACKKTILVTGASGNLGCEVLSVLHGYGHQLCAFTGSRSLKDELKQKVLTEKQVNLTEETLAATAINELIKHYPAINAAVLLVGGYAPGDVLKSTMADIDQQIALNFKTAIHAARPLMEHFKKNGGGQFVFIGSKPGLDPKAGKESVGYALGKAMVMQLAEMITAWGKAHHIHATVIVPSIIDTPQNRQAMPDANPSKWVKATDLAETIAFVLSGPGDNLRETVVKVYGDA